MAAELFELQLRPAGGLASVPPAFTGLAQQLQHGSLLHVSFPRTHGVVVLLEEAGSASTSATSSATSASSSRPRCRLRFSVDPNPELRLQGHALTLLRAPADAAAAAQQLADVLQHWATQHPHVELELSPDVAALDPGQLMLQGGYVLAGTSARGLLVEGGTPGASKDAPLAVRSVSKALAAVTVLVVQQQGLLSLDAHLSTYLPCFAAPELQRHKALTLRSVLCHTSGLNNNVFASRIMSDASISLGEAAALLAQQPLINEPGVAFAYSNSALQVAGAVVEAVTGRTWHEVFASEVAAPLGLRGTYWTNTACDERTPRNPLLGCGAISTPLDMAAFLRLLARKGQLSDGSGCLLQACTFQELVAAQSSGGGGDPVWAAVWAPRCTPPAPMQALVHAGLLHISDVQYACDRWGNLAYGLGCWRTCSPSGQVDIVLLGAHGSYVSVQNVESDDPTWAVWACMGCRPGWFRMAGILLARAAERSWGAGRGSNIDG